MFINGQTNVFSQLYDRLLIICINQGSEARGFITGQGNIFIISQLFQQAGNICNDMITVYNAQFVSNIGKIIEADK